MAIIFQLQWIRTSRNRIEIQTRDGGNGVVQWCNESGLAYWDCWSGLSSNLSRETVSTLRSTDSFDDDITVPTTTTPNYHGNGSTSISHNWRSSSNHEETITGQCSRPLDSQQQNAHAPRAHVRWGYYLYLFVFTTVERTFNPSFRKLAPPPPSLWTDVTVTLTSLDTGISSYNASVCLFMHLT